MNEKSLLLLEIMAVKAYTTLHGSKHESFKVFANALSSNKYFSVQDGLKYVLDRY